MDALEVSRNPVFPKDTASDVPCVALSFVKYLPILKKEPIHATPPAVLTLNAANGSLTDILGFTRFDLQLGDVTHPVKALVISSLPPDVLLDNSVMSLISAKLDWKKQSLSYSPFK